MTRRDTARADFHVHVGELVEHLTDAREVLRPMSNVERNECGLRMPGEYSIAFSIRC